MTWEPLSIREARRKLAEWEARAPEALAQAESLRKSENHAASVAASVERAYRLGRRDEAEAAFEAVRVETELRTARNTLAARVAAARALLAEETS